MVYKKFIIKSDSEDTIGIALEIIYNFSSKLEYISDTIVCVNTCYTFENITKLLINENELELEIIDIDEDNIYSSCITLSESLIPKITEFVNTTNISDDIDYFLELMSKRGGVEFLTGMEHQRLYELSKKII